MSSDDIRRSVQANRHDRAAGDAPGIGPVARMPGAGSSKGVRRKRAQNVSSKGNRDRNNRGRVIRNWSIALSALVFVILGLAVWLWLIPKMEPAEKSDGRFQADAMQEAHRASEFPSLSQTEAVARVRQGLAIRDPEKVAEYFRQGSADSLEIVNFLAGLESKDGVTGKLEWFGDMDANGFAIDGVVVNFTGTDKPRNRLALLTPDAAGKWQIDFDAFARTVAPPWSELLVKRAEVALVRVYVARDNYYNGPFQDDKQWVCYGIASPDTDQILLAYAKIGSAQAAAMDRIRSKDSRIARATLEIRRVAGGESRQFEISQVVAEDWVVGAVPFDEGDK
jgi:hypothetical protein